MHSLFFVCITFKICQSQLVCRHKVFKEARIVFREEAKVLHLVLQVGDALYAHTEGITLVFLAIDAVCFEHIGVNHTTTEDFYPTRVFTESTSLTTTDVT